MANNASTVIVLINYLSGDAVVKSTVTVLQTKPTVILIFIISNLYNYAFWETTYNKLSMLFY